MLLITYLFYHTYCALFLTYVLHTAVLSPPHNSHIGTACAQPYHHPRDVVSRSMSMKWWRTFALSIIKNFDGRMSERNEEIATPVVCTCHTYVNCVLPALLTNFFCLYGLSRLFSFVFLLSLPPPPYAVWSGWDGMEWNGRQKTKCFFFHVYTCMY